MEPLEVKGKPLSSKQLREQSEINELDIKRSINQSNAKLKKYLNAKG